MFDITIADLLGNYAFPAAMCVILLIQNNELRKEHKSETDKLTETIQNNTEALIIIKEHVRKENN